MSIYLSVATARAPENDLLESDTQIMRFLGFYVAKAINLPAVDSYTCNYFSAHHAMISIRKLLFRSEPWQFKGYQLVRYNIHWTGTSGDLPEWSVGYNL